MRRTAVVDLGSNSFRLVVFSAGEGWWKRTDGLHEAVRIAAGAGPRGELAPERVERALALVEVFAHFCAATGIPREDVVAVATSAIRDAPNRDEVLGRAALPVRVLSVRQEARLGYLAAVNSTTLTDGAVLDLGGGSLQLVRVEGRRERELGSWPLGAVRMTETFLPGAEPPSDAQLDRLREHVRAQLASAPWLAGAGRRLVAIGGTVRNLAAAASAAAGLPSLGFQDRVVSREAVDELVARLAALPASARGEVPGIKRARGEIILAGAVVVQAVLAAGGFDAFEVTEAGLREGVFLERHLASREPPLLADVRRASVENLAAQHGADTPHARHVAALALELFDGLAVAGAHPGDPAERELLWAAALLHDVGVVIDYDDHHKHSRYLVLNAGLPGFTPREVVLIAQMVRFHRKGAPRFADDVAPYARPGDEAVLRRGAALLRLAESLERGRDGLVRTVRVGGDGDGAGALRVQLDAGGQDARVALWAAERQAELFEQAFGRRLVLAAAR